MAMQFDADVTATSSPQLTSSQLLEDPYSVFAQMRAKGAVLPAPFSTGAQQKAWMVTHLRLNTSRETLSWHGALNVRGLTRLPVAL